MNGTLGTILIIEDESDIQEYLMHHLESAGFDILMTDTAAQGLKFLEKYSIDAIITDIRLPEMDGLEFLIIARKFGYEQPISIVSAFADSITKRRALQLGAFGFLGKPFEVQELLKMAHNSMKESSRKKLARVS